MLPSIAIWWQHAFDYISPTVVDWILSMFNTFNSVSTHIAQLLIGIKALERGRGINFLWKWNFIVIAFGACEFFLIFTGLHDEQFAAWIGLINLMFGVVVNLVNDAQTENCMYETLYSMKRLKLKTTPARKCTWFIYHFCLSFLTFLFYFYFTYYSRRIENLQKKILIIICLSIMAILLILYLISFFR